MKIKERERQLDELGNPYLSIVYEVYKTKEPIYPENYIGCEVTSGRIFKKRYIIEEDHFTKLEELGFLERIDDKYMSSELLKKWAEEKTKTRKPSLKEKFLNPLGLIYFHTQKYRFINLCRFARDKEKKILDEEYDKIGRNCMKNFLLKFMIPAGICCSFGLYEYPNNIFAAIGGVGWLYFGYNYEECKAGEKVAELVDEWRNKIIGRH